MKERPILFNGEMVRAILDGRKTQTRRVVKLPLKDPATGGEVAGCEINGLLRQGEELGPFGVVGDRLWVRETWSKLPSGQLWYRADGHPINDGFWTPSIHMPRWASRIDLEITAVRVERLQEITEEDAKKEGVNGGCLMCGEDNPCGCESPAPCFRDGFSYLWQSIYGTWEANPWVWVYEFRRVKP